MPCCSRFPPITSSKRPLPAKPPPPFSLDRFAGGAHARVHEVTGWANGSDTAGYLKLFAALSRIPARSPEVHGMKHDLLLTITSLLTLLLLTFHQADDIVLHLSPPGLLNLAGVAIMVVWLYGALALGGRRSGYIIMLLFGVLGMGVPVIHMSGPNGMLGPRVSASGHAFFFVWTCLAMGATSVCSALLAGRSLASLRAGQTQ